MPKTTEVRKSVAATLSAPENTLAELVPFVCPSCNLSARFLPVYRFNTHGVCCQILMRHAAMIQCAQCSQKFVWVAPEPGLRDGGWMRTNTLDDLEQVRP